jgi:hypothetical protein
MLLDTAGALHSSLGHRQAEAGDGDAAAIRLPGLTKDNMGYMRRTAFLLALCCALPLRMPAFSGALGDVSPRFTNNGLQLSVLTNPLKRSGARGVKQETVLYYRQRARAECEAALNATCPEARRAHAAMAEAYERLADHGEAEERSALAQLGEGAE